jgi:DNA-binding CsgD family transcriptional regulator
MRDLALADETAVRRWLVPAFPILQESAAYELWDDTLVHQLSAAVVRQARSAGALAGLPQALVYQAGGHLLAGEFALAATLVEEAVSIIEATGSNGPVPYHALLLAAWRGTPAETTRGIEAAVTNATARGEGRLLGLTGYASAVLYNGLGRFEEAAACARDACRYDDLGIHGWCLFELVEAASKTGDKVAATDAVHRLDERTAASGTDWGLGALAGARALLVDGAGADGLFSEAVERLTRTRVVVHLARIRLSYGEWLRAENRRTDARRELTAAHDMFTRMGAQAFAERARQGLIATGEKVRKQAVGTGDQLTTQETQIARLAADGLTNPEIGAQLFLSTHTVEWHLRKVFVKLGISSRRQLRTVSWAS